MNAMRLFARLAAGSVAVLLCGLPPQAKLLQGVRPGETRQSPEELAIEADPGAGVEHAVILVEEYERDEDKPVDMEIRYHLRAKILSNEGRDLGNVELPVRSKHGKLVEWWGRTIRPDGTVLELTERDLDRQTVARTSDASLETIKAALPGVEPGSVIDFGYVIRQRGFVAFDAVPLQRPYKTLEFRYGWRPYSELTGSFYIGRTSELDVQEQSDAREVLVRGRNLPPVVPEELMPPRSESIGMLYFYYLPYGMSSTDFWDTMARGFWELTDGWSKKSAVRAALDEIDPAPSGPLEAKLEALYDWIGAHLEREELDSYEDLRRAEQLGKERADLVRRLLEKRRGTDLEIDLFCIALARALGAEANLVFVVDRTENYWNPSVRALEQFAGTLVAVGPSGAAADALTVIDPGGGLPFGHAPWWNSGVTGMMIGRKKAESILVPLRGSQASTSSTRVELRFLEDNARLGTSWTAEASGQEGMTDRRNLRGLGPDERKRTIEGRCSPGDSDVTRAEVPDLDARSHRLTLHCATEDDTVLDAETDRYRVPVGGPWIREVPDLPDKERRFPVVLPYQREETTHVSIESPAGFAADEPPPPVDLATPFGRYRLEVARTERGFAVTRKLVVAAPGVSPEQYGGLREFFAGIRRHDQTSVAFTRRGTGR